MSRASTVEAYVQVYSSVLSGLLSSVSYQVISNQPAEIDMLLDVTDDICSKAIFRHDNWIATELSDHDR